MAVGSANTKNLRSCAKKKNFHWHGNILWKLIVVSLISCPSRNRHMSPLLLALTCRMVLFVDCETETKGKFKVIAFKPKATQSWFARETQTANCEKPLMFESLRIKLLLR